MAVLDAVLPAGADLVADNTGAAAIHHLPVRSAAGLRSRSARALRATPSGRVSEGHLCRQRHTVVIAGRRPLDARYQKIHTPIEYLLL